MLELIKYMSTADPQLPLRRGAGSGSGVGELWTSGPGLPGHPGVGIGKNQKLGPGCGPKAKVTIATSREKPKPGRTYCNPPKYDRYNC